MSISHTRRQRMVLLLLLLLLQVVCIVQQFKRQRRHLVVHAQLDRLRCFMRVALLVHEGVHLLQALPRSGAISLFLEGV